MKRILFWLAMATLISGCSGSLNSGEWDSGDCGAPGPADFEINKPLSQAEADEIDWNRAVVVDDLDPDCVRACHWSLRWDHEHEIYTYELTLPDSSDGDGSITCSGHGVAYYCE